MNNKPADWLRNLAKRAGQDTLPPVDVTQDVIATVAAFNRRSVELDKTPLVLGGSLVALAACLMLMLLPGTLTMAEPWVSFWLL